MGHPHFSPRLVLSVSAAVVLALSLSACSTSDTLDIVEIRSPQNGDTFHESDVITFRAVALGEEVAGLRGRVEVGQWNWQSNLLGGFHESVGGSSSSVSLMLPAGTHEILVQATDPPFGVESARITITVLPDEEGEGEGESEGGGEGMSEGVGEGGGEGGGEGAEEGSGEGFITGFVWRDENADGLYNVDDEPLIMVTVRLLDDGGNVVDSTASTLTTGYSFTVDSNMDIAYQVEFVAPDSAEFTVANQGVNEILDSDVDPMNGRTAVFDFFEPTGVGVFVDAPLSPAPVVRGVNAGVLPAVPSCEPSLVEIRPINPFVFAPVVGGAVVPDIGISILERREETQRDGSVDTFLTLRSSRNGSDQFVVDLELTLADRPPGEQSPEILNAGRLGSAYAGFRSPQARVFIPVYLERRFGLIELIELKSLEIALGSLKGREKGAGTMQVTERTLMELPTNLADFAVHFDSLGDAWYVIAWENIEGAQIASRLAVVSPDDAVIVLEELFREPLDQDFPYAGMCTAGGSGFFQNPPFIDVINSGQPEEAVQVIMQRAPCDFGPLTSNIWTIPISEPNSFTVDDYPAYPTESGRFHCVSGGCYRVIGSTRNEDSGDPDTTLVVSQVEVVPTTGSRTTFDVLQQTMGPGDACDGRRIRAFTEDIFIENGQVCVTFQAEDCVGDLTDEVFCVEMACVTK